MVGTVHPAMNDYKMQSTYLLVVFAIVLQHTFAENFLDILKKCKVTDPNLDDCVLRSANSLMSMTYKGSDKYGIKPFKISNENTTINFTEKFHLKLSNVSVNYGEGFLLTSVHLGIPEKLLTYVARCPHLVYEGNYEDVGEILGKPAHENGKLNITFDDVEVNGTVPLEFQTKNDKKYLHAIASKVNITSKNFQFIPSEQVSVGEPMTAEQKKEYQTYIDKIPAKFEEQIENLDVKVPEIINKIFKLPFEHYFAQ